MDLIGLAAMVYDPFYHGREMVTIKLSSGCFCTAKSVISCNISCVCVFFFSNNKIIPLALVGDEMIKANLALCASLAIYHLISNAHSWNNCLIYFR